MLDIRGTLKFMSNLNKERASTPHWSYGRQCHHW